MSRQLLNLKLQLTSKALKLYATLSSTSTPIDLLNAQTEVEHMYDELRRLFEAFQQNFKKPTLNFSRKNFMHSWQMTIHDMFKQ